MLKRNANIIFTKNGNGSDTTKITIPVGWIKELGFKKDDKSAIISIDDNKIIIEKGEFKMFRVVKFYDVYRKDLFDKYGAKNYNYYGDFSTTTEEVMQEFTNKKEALKYAEDLYNSFSNNEKVNISGNNIYFIRIDVFDFEDENDPKNIDSFGLSLEEYEEILKAEEN